MRGNGDNLVTTFPKSPSKQNPTVGYTLESSPFGNINTSTHMQLYGNKEILIVPHYSLHHSCLMLCSFHVFIILCCQYFGRWLGIIEEFADFLNFLSAYTIFAIDSSQQVSWCQQLYCISANQKSRQISIAMYLIHISDKVFVQKSLRLFIIMIHVGTNLQNWHII